VSGTPGFTAEHAEVAEQAETALASLYSIEPLTACRDRLRKKPTTRRFGGLGASRRTRRLNPGVACSTSEL
jgi:hypothetical protein